MIELSLLPRPLLLRPHLLTSFTRILQGVSGAHPLLEWLYLDVCILLLKLAVKGKGKKKKQSNFDRIASFNRQVRLSFPLQALLQLQTFVGSQLRRTTNQQCSIWYLLAVSAASTVSRSRRPVSGSRSTLRIWRDGELESRPSDFAENVQVLADCLRKV